MPCVCYVNSVQQIEQTTTVVEALVRYDLFI